MKDNPSANGNPSAKDNPSANGTASLKFYFVRHGQTDANKQRILQGWSGNFPLNETGMLQAHALAKRLHQFQFEKVWVSTLTRARQTAEILCQDLAKPLVYTDDLREWGLGEWEGQNADLYMPLFLGQGDPPGGETRLQFYERIEKTLKTALEGPTPLIVAHGGVWMAVQDLFKLPRFKISNCQIVELQYENGQWHQRVIEA